MGNAKPIPEGYHTATPYLIIKDAAQAIEFYKKALGAAEVMRFAQPDGKIGHAEIKIGDSHILRHSPNGGRVSFADTPSQSESTCP